MSFFSRKRSESRDSSLRNSRDMRSSSRSIPPVVVQPTPKGDSPKPEKLGDHGTLERPRRNTAMSTASHQSSQRSLTRSRSDSDAMVTSGTLYKKGVINLAYRKRWFVLTKRSLTYFNHKPLGDETATGSVALVHIDKVVIHKDNPLRLDIVTPTRILKVRTESAAESEKWAAAIKGAVQTIRQSSRRRLSMSPVDLIKLQESGFHSDTRIHQIAEIQSWPTWSPYDVAAWLGTFGPSHHGVSLYKAGVTGAKLPDLKNSDLESFGITKLEDQQHILTKIANLVKQRRRV